MPARYFFHAPDGRIYGPVDFATLQRWRGEGRVRDDSDLREEKEGPRLTYSELAARPVVPDPAPEPETPPPVLAAEEAAPPPPAPRPPATLAGMLAEGLRLYRRGFPLLWAVAAVVQTPLFVLNVLFPQHYDPKTSLPTWANDKSLLPILAGLLVAALFAEMGGGLLTQLVRQIDGQEPLSLAEAWRELKGRLFALGKTWLLRVLIIASWLLLAVFLYGLAGSLAIPAGLRKLMAIVLVFPALLLFLRYLISTQVVILEEKEGLQALRRSGDLVRFGSPGGPLASGDLRLLLLAAVPWVTIGILTGVLALLGAKLPGQGAAFFSEALSFIGAATATPLLVILFFLFVREAQRRLRETGYDAADES